MLIRSIRLHPPVKVSGTRSAMSPGLQPEACMLALPFLQASLQASWMAAAACGFWMNANA
jgi:hypothetical protein